MGWHEDGSFRRSKRLDEPVVETEVIIQSDTIDTTEDNEADKTATDLLRDDGRAAAFALGVAGVSAASLAILYRAHKKKGNQ